MKIKSIFLAIAQHNRIWMMPVAFLIFSAICCFTQVMASSYAQFNYLLTANSFLPVFLFYVPIIVISVFPINAILENEILCIRCGSHFNIYKNKIKAALILSALLILCKLIVELAFMVITGSLYIAYSSFYYFLIYIIQFGTIFFALLVIFLSREIAKNSALSVLIYLFIFGLDFLFSMLPINGVFYDLNLFCAPMTLVSEYVLSLLEGRQINCLFQLFFMMSKIIVVFIITSALISRKRRERFVKA